LDRSSAIESHGMAFFWPPLQRGVRLLRALFGRAKSQSRRSCAPRFALDLALLKSAGRRPAVLVLYRGPCAAVSRGRKGPQGHRQGCRCLFVRGRMPCRKARPRLTDLPGRWPGKRQAGWPSLWLLSLGQARESDSASAGGRNRFSSNRLGEATSEKQEQDQNGWRPLLRSSFGPPSAPAFASPLSRE
jgi:hypothetical protein